MSGAVIIYIAGKMTGIEDFNYPAFHAAAARLRAAGYEVISPAELHEDTTQKHSYYMRIDLRALLGCDAIYLLRGWAASSGARVEHAAAIACGMRVWIESSNEPQELPA